MASQVERTVTRTCDLCGASPAFGIGIAVNGLPPVEGQAKRKHRRRSIDLCGPHAERYDLGITGYAEAVREGRIELPEIGGETAETDAGQTVDLTGADDGQAVDLTVADAVSDLDPGIQDEILGEQQEALGEHAEASQEAEALPMEVATEATAIPGGTDHNESTRRRRRA